MDGSTVTDTEVRAAEVVVEDTLKESGAKIKLTELEGISSKIFLGLFEPASMDVGVQRRQGFDGQEFRPSGSLS